MTIAVIDTRGAEQVIHIASRRAPARFQRAIAALADLVDVGAHLHASDAVTQLWLTPRWQAARTIADLEHAWTPARFAGSTPSAIVAPALNRRLAVQLELVDGGALLAALELLRDSLGVSLEGTPGQTAEMLLRGALAKRGAFEPLRAPETLPLVNEPTLSWIRSLDLDEQTRPWVLAIDRRAAYLHSMALCDVGLGEPRHAETLDWRAYVWRPGYYHARIGAWHEVNMPDPIRLGRAGDWHWLTAPTLRLGEQLGLVLEVDEAWVWPRRSRVLVPLARRIQQARFAFSAHAPHLVPIGDPLLKRMYTEVIGRLRADFHRGTPLYRPDWYAHIVADARCRIWRAAYTMLREDAIAPAACNLDCWYVLSELPELPPAFRKSPLAEWWRLDAAAPVERVGLEVFDGQRVSVLSARVRKAGR